MDRQDIFNRIATHLLKQNKKCLEDGVCCYLNSQGEKCAIGAIIPDGHPGQKYVGGGAWGLLHEYPDLATLWNTDLNQEFEYSFLTGLQSIHDRNLPEDWRNNLAKFAKVHRLQMI